MCALPAPRSGAPGALLGMLALQYKRLGILIKPPSPYECGIRL